MRVIAHRGASAVLPENTLAAFRRALELGAAAVELDVQRSRDGRLVVFHDEDLGRLAGRPGRVEELAWDELARARVRGEPIPLLDEALELLEGRATVHVEAKSAGFEEPLLRALRARPSLRARVSCKDPAALRRFRELDAQLPLGYLYGASSLKSFDAVLSEAASLRAASLDLNKLRVAPERCARAAEAGIETLAYTVNDAEEARRLGKAGVAGVFSDRPDLLARAEERA